MINVRHLKTAMWDFLEDSLPNAANTAARSPFSAASTTSAPEPASLAGDLSDHAADSHDLNNEHVNDQGSDGKLGSHIPGARGFSELIDSLSTRISWQMAKELSISIALNCLLHLSNEKVCSFVNFGFLRELAQQQQFFSTDHESDICGLIIIRQLSYNLSNHFFNSKRCQRSSPLLMK